MRSQFISVFEVFCLFIEICDFFPEIKTKLYTRKVKLTVQNTVKLSKNISENRKKSRRKNDTDVPSLFL